MAATSSIKKYHSFKKPTTLMFANITFLTRNPLKKTFFPGDFCLPKSPASYRKQLSGNYFRNISGRRTGNIAVRRRGFVKTSFFFSEFGSFSLEKTAKFSLNFRPVRVHEKPSSRYVPSAFFAHSNSCDSALRPSRVKFA